MTTDDAKVKSQTNRAEQRGKRDAEIFKSMRDSDSSAPTPQINMWPLVKICMVIGLFIYFLCLVLEGFL